MFDFVTNSLNPYHLNWKKTHSGIIAELAMDEYGPVTRLLVEGFTTQWGKRKRDLQVSLPLRQTRCRDPRHRFLGGLGGL
jgi:hypothetical protein